MQCKEVPAEEGLDKTLSGEENETVGLNQSLAPMSQWTTCLHHPFFLHISIQYIPNG